MGINLNDVRPVEANIQKQTYQNTSNGQFFINLEKNQFLDLTKVSDNLEYATIGLGWDPVIKPMNNQGGMFSQFSQRKSNQSSKDDYDLDICLIFKDNGELNCAYFKNQQPRPYLSISEDNRTGQDNGKSDDEQAYINLKQVPPSVSKIFIGVSIFEATKRGQSFNDIKNCYVRVLKAPYYQSEEGDELCRFVGDNAGDNESLLIGCLERSGQGWKFTSIYHPIKGTIQDLYFLVSSMS